MLESEIEKNVFIDENAQRAKFCMSFPLGRLIANKDAWDIFGQVARGDLPSEDKLQLMAEMVRQAKK